MDRFSLEIKKVTLTVKWVEVLSAKKDKQTLYPSNIAYKDVHLSIIYNNKDAKKPQMLINGPSMQYI